MGTESWIFVMGQTEGRKVTQIRCSPLQRRWHDAQSLLVTLPGE